MSNHHISYYELEKELLDPTSKCFIENLLDLVTSLVDDCSYPSAKNSKAVQRFLSRYSQIANLIQSTRTKIEDFDVIKVIGQGGFGRVQLVRNKHNRRVYAMKMMSKEHLMDSIQPGYWEERDIMVNCQSEWLVACHEAFIDRDCVYLCMDYMPGGDLYHWLEEYEVFTEEQARFYLAETILSVEALHSMHFIHCDLKPDNLLLDSRGHLKLADFGSCVSVDPSTGTFYCTHSTGTPDYISPEVLNCQSKAGYIGPECDWWALGIICFEMIFGEPAFYGEALVETYTRILTPEKSLKFPDDVTYSNEIESLIRALLKEMPSNRLGSGLDGVNNLKNHSFFAGIDWLNLRELAAPIRPIVNSEVDTSNIAFDENDSFSRLNQDSGIGNKLSKAHGAFAQKKPQPSYFTGKHLSFAGYTFKRDKIYFRTSSTRDSNIHNQNSLIAQTDCSTVDEESTMSENCHLRNQLEIKVEEIETKEKKLVELKKQFEQKCNENELLSAKIVNLEIKSSDLSKIIMQKDTELETKRVELVDMCNKLEQKNPNDNIGLDTLKKMHSEVLDTYNQQINVLDSENKKLQLDIEGMRIEHGDILTDLYSKLSNKDNKLRSLYESQEKERKTHQMDIKTLNEFKESQRLELESIRGQRDEITDKCAHLEENVIRLTEDISKLSKEKNLLTIKLESSVKKLVQVTQQGGVHLLTPSSKQTNNRFRALAGLHNNNLDTDPTAYFKLEKKHKNLEAKFNEYQKSTQQMVDQLRNELSERNSLLAELTEENRANSAELAQSKAILASLYDRIDALQSQQVNKDLIESENIAPLESSGIVVPMIQNKENQMTQLETVVDLITKGRGRNKIVWTPKYAVLKPYLLSLYNSRSDKENGLKPITEIHMNQVLHAREASALDVHHAKKEDIPRVLQVIFEESALLTSGLHSYPLTTSNSTLSITQIDNHTTILSHVDSNTLDSSFGDNHQPQKHQQQQLDQISLHSSTSLGTAGGKLIQWQGHSFHPMSFRFFGTLCDVCDRVCSDLLNPPPALECLKCRLKLHAYHVEQCEKFQPCKLQASILLFRLPTECERRVWCGRIINLRDNFRAMQQNPEMLSSAEQHSAAVNAQARNLYRSMRGKRTGNSFSMLFRSNSKNATAGSIDTIDSRRNSRDSAFSDKIEINGNQTFTNITDLNDNDNPEHPKLVLEETNLEDNKEGSLMSDEAAFAHNMR